MRVKKVIIGLQLVILVFVSAFFFTRSHEQAVLSEQAKSEYWLLLHRTSNREYLYFGIPGDKQKSMLKKAFVVKTGIPGERPTPLPQKLGRKYWLIIDKQIATDTETAPYFLTLDIPTSDEAPYGPVPYEECDDQCNWEIPGAFGLHGVDGDTTRLSEANPGSSGCVRHSDEDISYLYTILDPKSSPVRYYIEDK